MNQNNERVIFLLDMDAFFASCHIAQDQSLVDTNLVVSSPNSKAIISTASYNARSFGIKAGMPLFKAQQLCSNLTIVKTNFPLYLKYSHQVFDVIVNNFTDKIEVASVDECYIDVTNIWKKFGSVKKLAQQMQNVIYEKTKLHCSIGISTNKFLAKTCVDFNKPRGISILLPKDVQTVLWPLKVKTMYMVGAATEKLLHQNNIFTIKDIALANQEDLKNLLGKRGSVLWFWANGMGSDLVEFEQNELKTIGNEFTLNVPTVNIKELEDYIFALSSKVSERAQKRYLKGRTISVNIKYRRQSGEKFDKDIHKKQTARQDTLENYTNDAAIIYKSAVTSFFELWNGSEINLIGVKLANLADDLNAMKQITINDIEEDLEASKNEIEYLIRELEKKFGTRKIFTGQQLLKYNNKNRSQSKYLKNDDIHISNDELLKKWNKKGSN